VLDVCGAGATPFRDRKSYEILDDVYISIIKGNSSEIARIAGLDVRTRGVDALEVGSDLRAVAVNLAKARNCRVVITGKTDIVADAQTTFLIHNGVEMMSHVVGTGCMAASVIGTFAGASPQDITAAAAAGLCCYEIAAELAIKKSKGPASFKDQLFDSIFSLKKDEVVSMQRVEQ
jgi:hydroxyethylthiazole kinase